MILILEGSELNFIWESIQKRQLIFHPYIAPEGRFDFDKFFLIRKKKILIVDRNILSSLLKLCGEGKLQNLEEMKSIGLMMIWAFINDFSITAGEALQEYATRIASQDKANEELNAFFKVFDYYSPQIWLEVAYGKRTEIPILSDPQEINVKTDFTNGSNHYYIILPTMIHIIILLRNKRLSPVDKFIELYDWILDNSLICEYVITYAAMLFTNQKYIKAPKYANSNDIDKVLSGCKNQSWDIAYLSEWSVFYTNTSDYPEEFFFTTSDIMLKRIFINTHAPTGVNGLLFEVYSKKDYQKIMNHLQKKMTTRRKPVFGDKPDNYFKTLTNREIDYLKKTIEGM